MIGFLERTPAAPGLLVVSGLVASVALLALAIHGLPGMDVLNTNAAPRVLKNSALPIIGQLANKGVDLIFAVFMLRLLGAEGNGQYAVAVVVWLYAKTIADFGLSVLVTRDVARAPAEAGRLIGATTLLRLIILLALTIPIGLYVLSGLQWFGLSRPSAIAIGLLTLTIVPGSYTEAINAVFNGYERMELPAVLNVLTNLARAAFGLAALLVGLGVVGLAAVAILSTTISAVAYHLALRHLDVTPSWALHHAEARSLLESAWPLLLNALLVNLFFRADVFIIQATHGDAALGTYDAAYKYLNMLLLIPAYFTLAIFPIISRYAVDDARRLITTFQLGAKLLLITALPITIATVALAPLLIRVLAGPAFLPDSATLLRVLIWFLPLSYVNGMTQYVLIAVDRQRSISRAFGIAVAFNLLANAIFVPLFGSMAAAAITVATELVLFVPLALHMRRALSEVPWGAIFTRPLLAGAIMLAVELAARPLGSIAAVALALVAYLGALVLTGSIGAQEAQIGRTLLRRAETPTV